MNTKDNLFNGVFNITINDNESYEIKNNITYYGIQELIDSFLSRDGKTFGGFENKFFILSNRYLEFDKTKSYFPEFMNWEDEIIGTGRENKIIFDFINNKITNINNPNIVNISYDDTLRGIGINFDRFWGASSLSNCFSYVNLKQPINLKNGDVLKLVYNISLQ